MTRFLVDLTRLIDRRHTGSPTGIDRVELEYAKHFLARPGSQGVVHLPFLNGLRLTDRAKTDALVGQLETRWVGHQEEDHSEWSKIQHCLNAQNVCAPQHEASGQKSSFLRGELNKLSGKIDHMTRVLPGTANDGETVYFHVSHSHLDNPDVFLPLKSAGVKLVFFVHDLIPITFPEYARPGIPERHVQRMTTVSNLADLIIVNSAATRDDLLAFQKARNLASAPVTVALLGVDHLTCAPGESISGSKPYFLFVSTIEARKNHAFLLALWRDLVAEHGEKAPKLVLVGKRGWEAENAFDLLNRCDSLREFVVELGSVSDTTLAGLYRGTAGVVFPSFTEGYSLPVLEALAWGIPTFASDIPVHRELGGNLAILLDPLDGPGWKEQIMRQAAASQLQPVRTTPPLDTMTWDKHFSVLNAALGDLTT